MSREHAALMDGVYRRQRHFYDATRKYYLFGRDTLIDRLDLAPGMTALEVGCGTGRNLALAAKRWPGARFCGFDISDEMLVSARAKIDRAGLADRVTLAQADAAAFDPQALFGVDGFDRVFFSYTLSMIPDWRAALARGMEAMAPDGRALAVDFGDQAGLPGWFRAALTRWLALFHVSQRESLREDFEAAARAHGLAARCDALYGGYAWLMAASSNSSSDSQSG